MIDDSCIALLGDFSGERLNIGSFGEQFFSSVCEVADISALKALGRSRNVAAVLVHAPTLGVFWAEALKAVQAAAPNARVVICHGMNEMHSRNEMIASGAYYALMSPLEATELRQALGFAWASRRSVSARPSPKRQFLAP